MRTYGRLMGFLRPYRLQLWGSLAFAWAAMGMTVLIPWLIGRAVNAIENGDKPDLLPLALAILGAGVLRLGLTVVRRLVAGRVSLAVEFDLRQRFYAHLQRLELAFFDGQQTGQLMSRATVDLQSIRFFLGYGLIFITQNLLTITLATAVMIVIDPLLTLIALAPAPLIVFVASRYNRVSRPAQQEVQQRLAELTAEAEENVSGIRIVKAFAREEHQLHRFQRAVARVFDQSIYATRLRAFFNPLIGFLPQFGIALVLLVGGRQVVNGSLSLGDFTAFYTYLVMLAGPLRVLGVTMGMAQRAIACGKRVFEVLDREPRDRERPGAPPLPAGGGRRRASRRRGRCRRCSGPLRRHLRRRWFSYVDRPVLQGVGAERRGRAARSPSSAPPAPARRAWSPWSPASTTPAADEVLIDGADVRDLSTWPRCARDRHRRRRHLPLQRLVAENIAYAPAGGDRRADRGGGARAAQADDFIDALPEGYETLVGERGLTLSGGQRQRIAIARALLADPRILILDDATSSVDATTEASIKRGLGEAMAGRTTFIIAHRLSTVSLADEIVVVDGGRIVDRGTHEELMAGGGFYREIAEHGLADSVFLQRDLEEREEMARL